MLKINEYTDTNILRKIVIKSTIFEVYSVSMETNFRKSRNQQSIPAFKDKLFAMFFGLVVGFSFLYSCINLNTDDYPWAEYYTFQCSRQALLSKINTFKERNPDYQLIVTLQSGQKVELKNTYTAHFCHIYFYLKSRNETLHCVMNISDTARTTQIGLEAVSKGIGFNRWCEINTKKLTPKENQELKRIFENLILDQLGQWRSKR